jgi:hypothetical protein
MLADGERGALDGIESELIASDPKLAESLRWGEERSQRRWKVIRLLAGVTAALMVAVGLFSDFGLLIFEGVMASLFLIAFAVLRRRTVTDS